MRKLTVLTVGQTPRSDLQTLFERADLPGVQVRGALDGLSPEAICRLTDGSTVLAERATLAMRLQQLIGGLEPDRTLAAVVACTAEFPELTAEFPVIVPGQVLPELVAGLGFGPDIAVITSNPGQVTAADRKWRAAGFAPYVTSDDPGSGVGFPQVADDVAAREPAAVILDCFGHDDDTRAAFARKLEVPVIIARSVTAAIIKTLRIGGSI
jgi:hypothetical protein